MITSVIQDGGRRRTLCESLLIVTLRFVALLLGIELAGEPQRILRRSQAGQRQINRGESGAFPAVCQNSTLNPSCVRRPCVLGRMSVEVPKVLE